MFWSKKDDLPSFNKFGKPGIRMYYLDKIGVLVGFDVVIEQDKHRFSIKKKDDLITIVAEFSLTELHGCCGICVSYGSIVFPSYRKKGLGTLLNLMRQQIAWNGGYTVMMCTDVDTNIPQQKILKKNGWTKIDSFKSRSSGNNVSIHALHLADTKIGIGSNNIDFYNIKAD